MRWAVLTVCALAALAVPGGAEAARAHPAATHTPTIGVWFGRDGHLWQTKRTIAPTQALATAAVLALLDGPSADEAAAGVHSAVPAGTRLRGILVRSGLATVNLSSAFAASAPRRRVHMRLAELTYTLTQFRTVDAVRLEIDGHAVRSIAGVAVPSRLERARYARLLPPILVWNPAIGARIPTTVTVSGTSDVFEATMVVKVKNARGRLLARVWTTASCGTGCRGSYRVRISYHVRRAQRGTVVITDTGARGSRPEHIVTVPVWLSA